MCESENIKSERPTRVLQRNVRPLDGHLREYFRYSRERRSDIGQMLNGT